MLFSSARSASCEPPYNKYSVVELIAELNQDITNIYRLNIQDSNLVTGRHNYSTSGVHILYTAKTNNEVIWFVINL